MSTQDKQSETTEEEAVDLEVCDVLDEPLIDEETEAPGVESLQQDLEALREANNELENQYMRARADAENTRRISAKEVEKARKFALESFAGELLTVKDSLDQASRVDLSGSVSEQLVEQMSEGLNLTLRQLETVFDKFNIELVNPEAGDALDPDLHQAMTRQPSDEVDSNNILQTIQVGYTLNGRLLRPAMVIVSSGSA